MLCLQANRYVHCSCIVVQLSPVNKKHIIQVVKGGQGEVGEEKGRGRGEGGWEREGESREDEDRR